ncbi:1-deoxy-D-xylulose-5-phosphate reductoisomerase [Candidatus Chlorohelix sp.]|uniref:1-deoxy-D-xylulose-5-phosphate reductoisomerase n=1 Tax=Candidatus Chlorohelix sp. TaxID=3139201 RepID=UPI003026B9BC
MTKRIALLGCTGSIGQQTLDVISCHPEKFQLISIASSRISDTLKQQVATYKPKRVGIGGQTEESFDVSGYEPRPEVVYGNEGLVQLALDPEVDIVVVATSGQHGFAPTLAALKAGKQVALANKEVLVMAGELVTEQARKSGIQLRPIDSEHSAIWQSLSGEGLTNEHGEENWSQTNDKVRRLILTASGGPFRSFTKEQMANVTVEQAMKHPNWNMGPKITIDSATLFNKGLEVIEAHWLFGLPYDKVDVVVHSQSIIHSMVEYVDGSVKAQLGTPDMRLPIQYALGYPERLANDYPRLDFTKLRELNFELPDTERFPALRLAYEAGRRGGTYPTVLAAADEEAVRLFHERKITYLGIADLVERSLDAHNPVAHPTLDDIAEADRWARHFANNFSSRGSASSIG